jgi:flagellar protein FliS
MDNETKKSYTARISQANKSQLVVIIYELILDSLASATLAFQEDRKDDAVEDLKKAQGFLQEMRGSLDFRYSISGNLASLYRYINEQLVRSIVRQKNVNLESCSRVIQGLMSSFEEVAKQDDSGPVMENTQQVYAGLTYGKSSLNEISLDGSRGFRV